MIITWHGQYTLKIQSQAATVLIDPYAPNCGLSPLRMKVDIVALSNPMSPTMSHTNGIQGNPRIINTPGEYAINGLALYTLGWNASAGTEQAIQRWHIEHVVLLHVGALNRPLTDQELQEIEKSSIDILFLPIGVGGGLTRHQALELLTIIEPKIVIPIHFKLPKLKEELEGIEEFAKEVGADPRSYESKLTIKSRSKLPDGLATIILMP